MLGKTSFGITCVVSTIRMKCTGMGWERVEIKKGKDEERDAKKRFFTLWNFFLVFVDREE